MLLTVITLNLQPVVHAQKGYWQQEVHYKIDVSLNAATHALQGTQTLEYINNSPDTLNFIWFHLWPNAYKNNTTDLYRQLSKSKYRSVKSRSFSDRGYIDSLQFTVNGRPAIIEPHSEHIDIVKLLLTDDLLPGRRILIATPFYVKDSFLYFPFGPF